MKPTFACSVYAKTEKQWRELAELLHKLGYVWCVGVYMAYHTGIRYDRSQIVVRGQTVYSNWDEPGIIECNGDTGLFMALVTINANREKYRLFSNGTQYFVSLNRKMKLEYMARGYREVTAEEIQESRQGIKIRDLEVR